MKTSMEQTTYTIDATGRSLGRVASEAAHALLGKRSARYERHLTAPVKVVIENAGKLNLPPRRVKGKVYSRYTGFPGGLYETSMEDLIAKKGIGEVMRKTVDGMIPRNKLRTPRMKNLIVKE